MQVILNSDHHFTGSDDLATRIEGEVTRALERFGERVTRIEVHVADENSGKAGPSDKRCTMEARVRGHPPIAVTANAESIDLAAIAASDKLERALDSALSRLDRRRATTDKAAAGVKR